MNNTYTQEGMVITDVKIVMGKDSGNSYFKESWPTTPIMVFTMKIKGTIDHTEYQMCKLDDQGLLKNPVRSGFMGKDGKEVPATPAYDFVKAIEESVGSTKAEELRKMKFSPARFVNMPFKFGVKEVTGKDSGNTYLLLETSKQKAKDAEYRNANPNNGTEAFSIEDFNHIVKEVKGGPIDEAEEVANMPTLDPAFDEVPTWATAGK